MIIKLSKKCQKYGCLLVVLLNLFVVLQKLIDKLIEKLITWALDYSFKKLEVVTNGTKHDFYNTTFCIKV